MLNSCTSVATVGVKGLIRFDSNWIVVVGQPARLTTPYVSQYCTYYIIMWLTKNLREQDRHCTI